MPLSTIFYLSSEVPLPILTHLSLIWLFLNNKKALLNSMEGSGRETEQRKKWVFGLRVSSACSVAAARQEAHHQIFSVVWWDASFRAVQDILVSPGHL